jgi:hypothetical protein
MTAIHYPHVRIGIVALGHCPLDGRLGHRPDR